MEALVELYTSSRFNTQTFKSSTTSCSSENYFFVTLTSSNSKVYYAIALKFSAKQSNLITKKSMSAICEIMNINVGLL